MLDWLGDVTFTVSFYQLSGVCVTQQICVHNFHALNGPIMDIQQCVVITFISFLTDILSSFCA